MKVAIHTNALDDRGCGKTPFDYGLGLKSLGHEVCYITSGLSGNESAPRIAKHFPIYYYEGKIDKAPNEAVRGNIEKIVDKQKVDFVQMLKSGNNDQITPTNCKTGIHCVFSMNDPHGTVYAGVSENLAKKFNKELYVPHIIKKFEPTTDVRAFFNIPKDAIVIGRHGGRDSFDLPFVHEAIKNIVNYRKDVYFLFLSTNVFYEHERIKYIPWVEQETDVFNFINACDVMIHGRYMGETFGLAVAEFAICNKPVITWTGMWHGEKVPIYDTAHIDNLRGKALVYNNIVELQYILLNIDKTYINSQNWDTISDYYNEKVVMDQYNKVFLT